MINGQPLRLLLSVSTNGMAFSPMMETKVVLMDLVTLNGLSMGSLMSRNQIRPLKINCTFYLNIYWKSYARVRKNNTNSKNTPTLNGLRPFKIDCMFCVRICEKSYSRVQKQNTQHEKLHRIWVIVCVFFVKNKENPTRMLTQNIQSILNGLIWV